MPRLYQHRITRPPRARKTGLFFEFFDLVSTHLDLRSTPDLLSQTRVKHNSDRQAVFHAPFAMFRAFFEFFEFLYIFAYWLQCPILFSSRSSQNCRMAAPAVCIRLTNTNQA